MNGDAALLQQLKQQLTLTTKPTFDFCLSPVICWHYQQGHLAKISPISLKSHILHVGSSEHSTIYFHCSLYCVTSKRYKMQHFKILLTPRDLT